jgi:hypothetical protein
MKRPRNKQRDHERYMADRERILAQQKVYRQTHREEILERHRQWRNRQTVEKLRKIYGRNKD